jgi:hypothetical protein
MLGSCSEPPRKTASPAGRAAFRAALAGLALAAQPVAAQVGAVTVKPLPPATAERWISARPSSTACIDVTRIAGAVVVDPRTLDVVTKGGRRWRLTLAQQCPQLSYYGGFYYRPVKSGQFCAGRDRIMGRAGGECRVSRIARLTKAPARKR